MIEKPVDWPYDFPVLVPEPLLKEARSAHPDWWVEPCTGRAEGDEPFTPVLN